MRGPEPEALVRHSVVGNPEAARSLKDYCTMEFAGLLLLVGPLVTTLTALRAAACLVPVAVAFRPAPAPAPATELAPCLACTGPGAFSTGPGEVTGPLAAPAAACTWGKLVRLLTAAALLVEEGGPHQSWEVGPGPAPTELIT